MNKKSVSIYIFIIVFSMLSNYLPAKDLYVPYNSTDATHNIQETINSAGPGDSVILSNQGTKWISSQLSLKSNMKFVLEAGVLLESKSGAFTSDIPFIKISGQSQVTVSGNGATIRMLLEEYSDGEHRHCLSVTDSSHVTIRGLKLEKSGGDGIYLGAPYNNDVLIENVIFNGHARNGIGIISAKNVTVDHCKFFNTGQYNPAVMPLPGPFAGIDFEPNHSDESLENITISDCEFYNNKKKGIIFILPNIDHSSQDVSISINGCRIKGGERGIVFGKARGTAGSIDIDDCVIEDTSDNGIFFRNWGANSVDASISNCTLINPTNIVDNGAIEIRADADITHSTGNLELSNVSVFKSKSPHVLALKGANSRYKIKNISGSIYTDQPATGVRYNSHYNNINVSLHRLLVNFSSDF